MKGIAKYWGACLALFLSVVFFDTSAFGLRAAPHRTLIPESLIQLDCNAPGYALVVEKKTQTIWVYACDGTYRQLHRFPCSTGEAAGKKERPGDRKTPEGVYFFTASFEKKYLSSTYGNRAFVMDYPNLLDRLSGRSGDNIWLHGTNKQLRPRDTNGCVAVENGNIDILARYIRLNDTPIIIKKELNMVPPGQHAACTESLRQFVADWRRAFLSADKATHASFYTEPSPALQKVWAVWEPLHQEWSRTETGYDMELRNIAVARANPCLVVLLDQSVRLGDYRATVGRKKLFVEQQDDQWKIVGETYQGVRQAGGSQDPLVLSLQRLGTLRTDYKAVAERVAEWADAWSAKDIERYRACYSEDFRGRGMNLPAWIRYKDRLNKQYDFIDVNVEDLQIEQNGDRSTATFVQRYHSSGHKSVGSKRLRLKRTDGEWKIERERWLGTRK